MLAGKLGVKLTRWRQELPAGSNAMLSTDLLCPTSVRTSFPPGSPAYRRNRQASRPTLPGRLRGHGPWPNRKTTGHPGKIR